MYLLNIFTTEKMRKTRYFNVRFIEWKFCSSVKTRSQCDCLYNVTFVLPSFITGCKHPINFNIRLLIVILTYLRINIFIFLWASINHNLKEHPRVSTNPKIKGRAETSLLQGQTLYLTPICKKKFISVETLKTKPYKKLYSSGQA